ncbi:hypothetical protein EMIHUDRAFT_417715 [Emiliania huxleyi CCMP1516]|uniref:50S ribosomal protein L17 n=2 Tax=Emiliania huxleyi TaxID=2903 RepID=A0A0D3KMM5_EMIH1|nr:hypothetical protein EMIHUDRAFT_417715 [Emiliania huxleyi CCMP1516]EOD37010.1 hypothetical protein EMIHUDRAFT_417715 [Emiliania huxleyi CCMP1516]|eukprot:XP_005789439.1 hypothetical protein EMIHUDRAFT_417715 [Emiliania huxleyi CCMP1516]
MRSTLALLVASLCGATAFVAPAAAPLQSVSRCASPAMISHGKGFRKLNKPADQRKALLRSLTTELIRHGKIQTTLARCKEVRKTGDHMITLAKDVSLHARGGRLHASAQGRLPQGRQRGDGNHRAGLRCGAAAGAGMRVYPSPRLV